MAETAPEPGTGIEMPSGKSEATENFPVGSLLLPPRLRPHVAAFYAFARAADDIADNDALEPQEKIDRLDRMEQGVLGQRPGDDSVAKAARLHESLTATHVTPQHAVDLLAAFKQDAVKRRYRDWDDLMAYCRLSASPVGRYLLDLHGEDPAEWWASDALCDALQVINHLQDCQDDYREIDRVYLPEAWLTAAGIDVTALDAPLTSPALRQVLDQCLDGTEVLMQKARRLPGRLRDRRLAMESAVIVRIADNLVSLLRQRDPLATRVKLPKTRLAFCALGGVMEGLFGRRPRRTDRQAA